MPPFLRRCPAALVRRPLAPRLAPPPPPRQIVKQPPPPPAAAPPPYVPPPEVTPPAAAPAPVITAVTATPPIAPPVIAPPPPPAPPAPVAVPVPAPPAPPPKPTLRRGVTPIRQARPDYPRRALQDEIEGEVIARASVSREGKVVAVTIVSAKPRGVFERSVETALRQYEFPPDETDYIVEVPFTFRLE